MEAAAIGQETGESTDAAVPGANAGDVSFIVFNYLEPVVQTPISLINRLNVFNPPTDEG